MSKELFDSIKKRMVHNGFSFKEEKAHSKCDFFKSPNSKYKIEYDNETIKIKSKHAGWFQKALRNVDQVNEYIEFFFYNEQVQRRMIDENILKNPEIKF